MVGVKRWLTGSVPGAGRLLTETSSMPPTHCSIAFIFHYCYGMAPFLCEEEIYNSMLGMLKVLSVPPGTEPGMTTAWLPEDIE